MNNAGLAGCEGDERHHTQHSDMADTRLTVSLPACTRGYPWTGKRDAELNLADFPNEVLLHILSYLDVCDLLATSRVSAVALLLLCESFLRKLCTYLAPNSLIAVVPRRVSKTPYAALQRVPQFGCSTF